jgi:hypothetical protein
VIASNTNLSTEQLNALSPNDRREVLKMKKYLKLQRTKHGREVLRTQKYWRDYQGI